MASIYTDSVDKLIPRRGHPVLYHHFTKTERERMVNDDLAAGYSIPALLTGIVCIGLITMAISVLIALS